LKRDDEIEAMAAVLEILQTLRADQAIRIIEWVSVRISWDDAWKTAEIKK
jgi:hypothetical protein